MKKLVFDGMPFFLILIFVPIYVVLDAELLVDIFGCGCVPSTQENLLHIPFNANDLRDWVFRTFTAGMTVLAIWRARSFRKIWVRIPYCAAALALNGAISVLICSIYVWK